MRTWIKTRAENLVQRRLDSISNFINGLGTDDDAVTQGRPTTENRLSNAELDALYISNDLARRIVNELVEDATRVAHSKKPVPFEEGETDFHIAARCREAGINGRLGGAGLLLFVTDQEDTTLPLDPESETLLNIVVLDAREFSTAHYQSDITKPNYGDPEILSITPNAMGGTMEAAEFHVSRTAYFGGASLPRRLRNANSDKDDSVLQAVWAVIQRFEGTEMAIANILQRFEIATISISGLADILSHEDGAALIQSRLNVMHRSLSMINAALIDADAGEAYSRAFATVNGMDTLWDRLAHSVAKAARMPMTQLFGMSPSGLSTDDESGKANWRKQVNSYQEQYLRPALETYYALLKKDVEIEFAPLDETSPTEEASIHNKKASTAQLLVTSNILTPEAAHEFLKVYQVLPQNFEYEEPDELEPPQNTVPNLPMVDEGLPEPALNDGPDQQEGRPEGVREEEARTSDP